MRRKLDAQTLVKNDRLPWTFHV